MNARMERESDRDNFEKDDKTRNIKSDETTSKSIFHQRVLWGVISALHFPLTFPHSFTANLKYRFPLTLLCVSLGSLVVVARLPLVSTRLSVVNKLTHSVSDSLLRFFFPSRQRAFKLKSLAQSSSVQDVFPIPARRNLKPSAKNLKH